MAILFFMMSLAVVIVSGILGEIKVDNNQIQVNIGIPCQSSSDNCYGISFTVYRNDFSKAVEGNTTVFSM